VQFWITGLVGVLATIEDLARRTVSNWLSLAALSAGAICQAMAGGWKGLGMALLGAVAGFAVFLVFYVLGGMGGGDVKLMAGFGAVVGLSRVLEAAFWTALTGGLLAAAVIGFTTLRSRIRKNGVKDPVAIPYAPAIVLGVWLTLLANK
jgi:prepilin peptidase CpaA